MQAFFFKPRSEITADTLRLVECEPDIREKDMRTVVQMRQLDEPPAPPTHTLSSTNSDKCSLNPTVLAARDGEVGQENPHSLLEFIPIEGKGRKQT